MIVGRTLESRLLKRFVEKKSSEFVVIHGRRRVGKTYLIREFFNNEFTFYISGLANSTTEKQLINFEIVLQRYFGTTDSFNNWIEAFHFLIKQLEATESGEKKVIFFDELPWFDTNGSDFLSGLEYFWNGWASARKDILLITCGSAAAWMINNLINNNGGLHNRVTQRIKLHPFTLAETEEFLKSKGCVLSHYQIAQIYMTMGGIPFYLNAISKELSAQQNIHNLFFDINGLLRDEFKNLYRSLFSRYEIHEAVVETLSKKAAGFSRQEIIEKSKLQSGGTLTKILNELEESGFISSYTSIEHKKKNTIYRLSDYYTNFYFRFLNKKAGKIGDNLLEYFNNPDYIAWCGFAFEQLCLDHIQLVKEKIGIAGVQSTQNTWVGEFDGDRAQIDFIIDRNDQVVNICECKFSRSEFVIDKKYGQELAKKIDIFRRATGTKKAIFLTMITANGVKKNEHAGDLVQNEVLLEDLFKPHAY